MKQLKSTKLSLSHETVRSLGAPRTLDRDNLRAVAGGSVYPATTCQTNQPGVCHRSGPSIII